MREIGPSHELREIDPSLDLREIDLSQELRECPHAGEGTMEKGTSGRNLSAAASGIGEGVSRWLVDCPECAESV